MSAPSWVEGALLRFAPENPDGTGASPQGDVVGPKGSAGRRCAELRQFRFPQHPLVISGYSCRAVHWRCEFFTALEVSVGFAHRPRPGPFNARYNALGVGDQVSPFLRAHRASFGEGLIQICDGR